MGALDRRHDRPTILIHNFPQRPLRRAGHTRIALMFQQANPPLATAIPLLGEQIQIYPIQIMGIWQKPGIRKE